MFRLRTVSALAVAMTLSVAISPALADAPGGGGAVPVGSASHIHHRTGISLPTLVVNGQRIPMAIALTYLKTMLRRPWSTSAADLDKTVCRIEPTMGSHFDTMRCETNRQHFKDAERTRQSLMQVRTLGPGSQFATLYAEVASWIDNRRVNRGALREMLKKLPPPGSSYTLQVTDHGKVVAKYIVKKGKLVKVIKMNRH